MDNNYTLYMHKNKENGKVYIGITCRNPEERWANGNGYYRNNHFYNSIKKYGWDNFEHIIIASGLTQEKAEQMEIEYIAKYDSTNRNKGYNISLGGNSVGRFSNETKEKIRQSHLGMKHKPETITKLKLVKQGKNNPMYGKKLSKEHVELLRSLNIGRKKSEYEILRIKEAKSFRVFQYSLDGKFLNSYYSTREAERITGVQHDSISSCCNLKHPSSGGYIWKYEKDGFVEGQSLKGEDIPKNKNKKSVQQFDIDGNLINTFETIKKASDVTGIDRHVISNCCKGKIKNYRGYVWKFI